MILFGLATQATGQNMDPFDDLEQNIEEIYQNLTAMTQSNEKNTQVVCGRENKASIDDKYSKLFPGITFN